MTARRPIGVFDSGAGGLTVVRALRRALPGEDIVYLGDTARVPYGSKSPRTVERYSLACLRFLLRLDVKLVLIACNTASANAIGVLREATDVHVVGAVLPGARSAVATTRNKHIGVIGTLSTIRSEAYPTALSLLDPAAVVTGQACPLLVPLAEEGWIEGGVAEAIARRYVRELLDRDPDIDTLVLGCTHYPLLSRTLSRVVHAEAGRPVALVDSATAMAQAASRELGEPIQSTPGPGKLSLFVTDATRLDELASRFLGEPSPDVALVDL